MRFFTLLLFILVSTFGWSQTTNLTTTFKFINIEEGYDHLCKTQVWVDGQMVGESAEVYESKGTSFTVQVPQGEHRVRIVNLAKYEGNWEEHTVENNYSIDCMWEGTQSFGSKAAKVFMLFDIDNDTQISWKKMPKPVKS